MKSAKVFYKIAYLIIVVLVAVFTVGSAFAWFFDRKDAEFSITGSSAGAYFESGNGSAEKPFIISNTTHMHNLAVLQNTGKLDTKYYYQIKKGVDIDMSGRYIPPIGNDAHPFIGDFNGNGQTLKNLQVTTNKTLLEDEYPLHATRGETGYKFSQAVGLFGMTGASSDIHNVILENPKVDVSATDTAYSSTARAYAGLAVGVVNGKASSIGVRAVNNGSALDVKVTGYSTFNSILGALGDGVTSSVTGGGHGNGGSGASFGSSFDVEDMVRRLNLIKDNKASSTPSWHLPNVDTGSNYTIPDKGAKMPFSIIDGESSYTGADAREKVSSSNVGYFLGNQNKIGETAELSFSDKLIDPGVSSQDWYTVAKDGTRQSPADSGKVPAWIYKFDGGYSLSADVYTSQMGFAPLSQEEFDALPQDIKNIFPENLTEKKRFLKISLSTALWTNEGEVYNPTIRLADDNGVWSYHGQISWMGKTYGEGFRGADGDAVNEKGEKYSYVENSATKYYKLAEFDKGIMLPNSTIWFKPSQAGKVKIIMFSPGNLRGFALLKITRKSANKNNPFKAEITRNADWSYNSDIVYTQVMRVRLPKNVLFYYEYEITQDTIDAGNVEYMMVGENNGADFIYLDLGASAAADTSTIDREKAVSAVDFIYDGVEINQKEGTTDSDGKAIAVGNFIVSVSGSTTAELYEASKTSVYFENLKAVLNVVYIRLYSGSTSHTDKSKTICLEKSDPVPDTNSEVKATNTTYVCPTIGSGSGGGTTTPDPGPTPDTPTVTGVTVTPATATVEAGKTTTLSASVTMSDGSAYGGNIVWTSSDEDIATVENGVVTAKTAGTVTITATAGDQSARVEITVEENAGVVYLANGTFSVADGTLSKSLILASDGIEMSSNSYDTSTTATWSGTINGASVNFGTCMRAGGNNGRYIAINVKAGTKISVAFGGNYANNDASASMWIGESSSTAQNSALASQTAVNVGKTSASGLLEYTAKADGTYYIIFDTTKPVIFAIVLS